MTKLLLVSMHSFIASVVALRNIDDAVDNDEKSGIFLEQYYIIKTSYSEYIIKTSAFLKLVDSPDIEPKEL